MPQSMLHLESARESAANLSRRDLLRAGFLGIGGLTLGQALRLAAATAVTPKDTAVILLFVHGGPSHLETYDMKPRATAEIRGPFDPIRTKVPGVEICEHLPRQAIEILTSGRAERAFNLALEDPRIREKYGDGYGQEVLTARRLVEAGVRFVTVRAPGGGEGTKAYDWDDHAVNWDMRTAMLARLPKYDHVVATLIEDLFDRGLAEKVLLIVTGEFGRTPRLEYKDGKIGRDHWPSAMSILMTGGGAKTGRVIGATDHIGARPSERPLDPHDILATVYHHLGIDPQHFIPDPAGRPIALTEGKPIAELF